MIFTALMIFAGWFHYHKAAPKMAWFQNVKSWTKLFILLGFWFIGRLESNVNLIFYGRSNNPLNCFC
jgi:hypothetical protein